MAKRGLIVGIVCMVLGVALMACWWAGLLDEYWSAMGMALLVVGVLRGFRYVRYRTDEDYRTARDIANTDERNRFLANKAWAWAGYLFVLIAAVATVTFAALGEHLLMRVTSIAVCLLILLYWGSYMVLRRKY